MCVVTYNSTQWFRSFANSRNSLPSCDCSEYGILRLIVLYSQRNRTKLNATLTIPVMLATVLTLWLAPPVTATSNNDSKLNPASNIRIPR